MKIETSTNKTSSTFKNVLLIVGVIFVSFNLRPAITSVSPLIGEIMSDTGISTTLAGFLTALPVLSFAVFSLLAPKIALRIGLERTIWVSLCILMIGMLIRSTPFILMLFLGTMIIGVAIAIGNVLMPSLVKNSFPLRIGLMTGLYTTSMNLFAGLASGVAVPLSQGLGLGWRKALLVWIVFAVLAMMVWLPQVRNGQGSARLVSSRSSVLWRSGLAWQVTLYFGLQSMCYYSIVAWLPELLHDRGLSVETAGWMLALAQLLGLPATFIVPTIAGRISQQKWLSTVMMTFTLVGFTGLLFCGTSFVLLWIIILGLGIGGTFSLGLAFMSLRASNAREAAELSGMAQSLGYMFGAAAPVLFGLLYDITHAWSASLVFLIVVSIVQTFMGLGAGRNATVTPQTSND